MRLEVVLDRLASVHELGWLRSFGVRRVVQQLNLLLSRARTASHERVDGSIGQVELSVSPAGETEVVATIGECGGDLLRVCGTVFNSVEADGDVTIWSVREVAVGRSEFYRCLARVVHSLSGVNFIMDPELQRAPRS